MKTTQKFTTKEQGLNQIATICKSLPHKIDSISNIGEVMFEVTSPIDPGYIVVCGSLYMNHDEKNNQVWTLNTFRGM